MVTDMAAAAAAGLLLCFSASIELDDRSFAVSWKAASERGSEVDNTGQRDKQMNDERPYSLIKASGYRVRRCMIEYGSRTVPEPRLTTSRCLCSYEIERDVAETYGSFLQILFDTSPQCTHAPRILPSPNSFNRLTCLWCLHF